MYEQPQMGHDPKTNTPIGKNKTPLLAKLAGLLCGLAAFCVFLLMFTTDTYERVAVMSGIVLAICCYLLYRTDVIYPILAAGRTNSASPEHDEIPAGFCACWTIGILVLAGSIVAWFLFATPVIERFRSIFGL